MGTKRSVLTDENGLPLAVVLSGANTHDVKLLEDTLDHIVALRPEADEEHPQNLCLDAGYTGSTRKICVWMLAIRAAVKRCSRMAIRPIFVPAARKRRNWNVARTSGPAVGLLRSHTLFSIVFVNCWSVMKRKPTIIWLLFSLLALLLSGANSCPFIANRGFIPLHWRKSFLCTPLAIYG